MGSASQLGHGQGAELSEWGHLIPAGRRPTGSTQNAIKALARCGQGYSLSDEGLAPVVYGMTPPLSANYPLPRKDQKAARGLRLYETFVAG